MQESDPTGQIRSDLLNRLKALDTEHGSGSLAELAYRRAREALESALEEARSIRLQALDEARRTREQETVALAQTLQSQQRDAQAAIEALLRQAEIEAEGIRSRAAQDAEGIVKAAEEEAKRTLAEASRALDETRTLRADVDERERAMERLEAQFNQNIAEIAGRLGVIEEPAGGWWRRIMERAGGRKRR